MSTSAPYGCHNKPRTSPTYMAQDGYDVEQLNWGNIKRHPRYVSVKNVFSVDCKYTLSRPHDARCAGCRHKMP